LRIENQQLRKELDDAHLDLDDARRSRREMQQQLQFAMQRMEQSEGDRDNMRVSFDAWDMGGNGADVVVQNRNPYIQVLIDGDGMIVSSLCIEVLWV